MPVIYVLLENHNFLSLYFYISHFIDLDFKNNILKSNVSNKNLLHPLRSFSLWNRWIGAWVSSQWGIIQTFFRLNPVLLLLLLSGFSSVWLCATPWTAAHQAPRSTRYSRQEYWSGLPFPSLQHCLVSKYKEEQFWIFLELYHKLYLCYLLY